MSLDSMDKLSSRPAEVLFAVPAIENLYGQELRANDATARLFHLAENILRCLLEQRVSHDYLSDSAAKFGLAVFGFGSFHLSVHGRLQILVLLDHRTDRFANFVDLRFR
jgi:hypothetical protein